MAPIATDDSAPYGLSPANLTIMYAVLTNLMIVNVTMFTPFLKIIFYPYRFITIGLHECGHALAASAYKFTVESIEMHATFSTITGITTFSGPIRPLVFIAGYLMTALFNTLISFFLFSLVGTQAMAILLGLALLPTLIWGADWKTKSIMFVHVIISVAVWYLSSGLYLVYWMLFLSVALWFEFSPYLFIKTILSEPDEGQDISKFAKAVGVLPARVWAILIWIVHTALPILAFVLGTMAFPNNA
jgi:hypothetical protein